MNSRTQIIDLQAGRGRCCPLPYGSFGRGRSNKEATEDGRPNMGLDRGLSRGPRVLSDVER